MFQRGLPAVLLVVLAALPAAAQDRRFALSAPVALEESGLLAYLLPRFSLKTGIRITPVGADAPAEAVLGVAGAEDEAVTPVFADAGGTVYGLRLTRPAAADPAAAGAARFADWLMSETGLRTLEGYAVDGVALYTASLPEPAEEAPSLPQGDVALGEELSLLHCGRCHVVSAKNRMKGLGSTPSFGALKALADWDYRFQVFYVLNPHPAFTQIAEVTPPFDPMLPSPIAPVRLTETELEAILAFVGTVPPADLGAPVQSN